MEALRQCNVYVNDLYKTIPTCHLREKEMSLKAKGLLTLVYSLPADWDYSIAGLVAICAEGTTAVESALDELKRFGYLEVIKLMPNETPTGRISYIYNFYPTPHNRNVTSQIVHTNVTKNQVEVEKSPKNKEKQEVEKQGVGFLPLEKQGVGFLPLENQGQYIIDINNNNKTINSKTIINTNNKKEKDTNNKLLVSKKKKESTRFSKPDVEKIRAYCEERKNHVDAQKFYDYYESIGWKVGKNPMKDWKACVRTWERNGYNNYNSGLKNKSSSYGMQRSIDFDDYEKAILSN